jgi:hypothetical protein
MLLHQTMTGAGILIAFYVAWKSNNLKLAFIIQSWQDYYGFIPLVIKGRCSSGMSLFFPHCTRGADRRAV